MTEPMTELERLIHRIGMDSQVYPLSVQQIAERIEKSDWLAAQLEAAHPVTDEEVQAVLEHRWHTASGRCACGEHFGTLETFVRHTLEAARGVQRS